MDLERESPQLSGIKRKFATFLHEAEWLLFVVDDGFVYVFVLLLRQYFSVAQCFFNILSFFSKNIYYCWNLVVRYEKWEWSLCRGYVFKRRRFAVLSTTLTSPSLRIQCDFCDKEHRGNLMYPTRCLSRSLSQSTHSGSMESRRLFLFLLELVSLSFLLLAFWGLSLYFW